MRNRVLLLVSLLVIAVFISGCKNSKGRYIPDVGSSNLPDVTIHIKRYGEALFELDSANFKAGLKSIKPDFLLFLDASLDDTANVNQLRSFVLDTVNRYLFNRTMKVFPDLTNLEKELSRSFSYYHYYFPNMEIPSFYSYISGGYYEEPVLLADSVVLIGLDNFLGGDFVYYARMGIPRYKMHWMTKAETSVEVMREMYQSLPLAKTKPKNLLDMMISSGKELYFLDAMMPDVPDSLKIKYTAKQLEWVNKNAKNIWAFLIEQRLLFSADFMKTNKLMQDGPFTKGFDGYAPARLGEWVGWQIVSTYMESHPDVSLKKLLQVKDSQKILKDSGYKP